MKKPVPERTPAFLLDSTGFRKPVDLLIELEVQPEQEQARQPVQVQEQA